MNIAVSVSDERSIEVLASGLPAHHGAQLAVDITLRSLLTAQGERGPMQLMSTELCSHQPGVRKLPDIGNFSKVADATLLWWASRPVPVGVKRRGFIEMLATVPEAFHFPRMASEMVADDFCFLQQSIRVLLDLFSRQRVGRYRWGGARLH